MSTTTTMPLSHRKRRRKSVSSTGNVDWKKADVDTEDMFKNASIDGFLGLEELTDYNDEDLKHIIDQPTIVESSLELNEGEQKLNKVKAKRPKKSIESRWLEVKDDSDVLDDKRGDNSTLEGGEISTDESKVLSKVQKKKQALILKQKKKKLLKIKEKMKARKLITQDICDISNENTLSEEPKLCITINKTDSSLDSNQKKKTKSKRILKLIKKKATVPAEQSTTPNSEEKNLLACTTDMSEWKGLSVPDCILRALSEKHFSSPTPIQYKSLPAAIEYRQDVIGAAETGSGKTLAFGIPLLTLIMRLKENAARATVDPANESSEDNPLFALVLTPTRELAIQVHKHITDVAKYSSVRCMAIVGGMATAKQQRLLSRKPDIVVATPGRLNKLIGEGEEHLSELGKLKFLVIDECDRMLEFGHFKDLDDIICQLNRPPIVKRQLFVFSATLTLPQWNKKSSAKDMRKTPDSEKKQMQSLIDRIGLNEKAKVVDLTTKQVTAKMLEQKKLMCTEEEKDAYLYYFLRTHPGRTIVFANSISCTKKLHSLFTLLQCEPVQLHSGKQQRQRLKYLERFTASENGLLIATDVAARGLDIPGVRNVVHYHLPLDPRTYVHRAGRTARASEGGTSVMLEGPRDFKHYKKISQLLNLSEDIPSLPVDTSFMSAIKERVGLADSIEKLEHRIKKASDEAGWAKRAAQEMDIEDDDAEVPMATKKERQEIAGMKKSLNQMIAQTIYPKGFSGSFPTRGGFLRMPGLSIDEG